MLQVVMEILKQHLKIAIAHHLKKCRTEINETFVDNAEH